MTIILKKKDTRDYQDQARVKIYYLKNENVSKKQINVFPTHLAGPSLSCLSSMIQKEKDIFQMDNLNNFAPKMQPINEIPEDNNFMLTQQMNLIERKISQMQNQHQNQSRNAYLGELRQRNKARFEEIRTSSPNNSKRFSKTAQQQNYSPTYHKNNGALKKDFLCNIIGEWNTVTQKEKPIFRKSPLKKWKRSIDSQQKTYRPEDIEKIKSNNSLMNEHFNIFLENQREKSTKKKQKSLTLLTSVFHREESLHQIPNKNFQGFRGDFRDLRGSRNQSPLRVTPSQLKAERSAKMGRRHSLNQKVEKGNYMRLLYGPQVKLVPRLFEQRIKMKNFDWTRLDEGVYQSRRKIKAQSPLLHD